MCVRVVHSVSGKHGDARVKYNRYTFLWIALSFNLKQCVLRATACSDTSSLGEMGLHNAGKRRATRGNGGERKRTRGTEEQQCVGKEMTEGQDNSAYNHYDRSITEGGCAEKV